MSNALPAARGKSVAVTLVALCTLIWGWGYALVGGYLILVWAEWLPGVLDDLLPGELNDLPNRITSIRITTAPVDYVRNEIFWAVFGVLFLIFGLMANLAALGLFWRKPWGRIVTFLVAVLAISIVLVPLITEVTFISPIQITTNIPLRIAQVLYGILAFAVLSRNPDEPRGIYIVRLINFSVGLPLMLLFGMYLFDAIMLLFHPEPVPNTDSRFATLIIPSGLIAGSMLFASSLCLLISRWKRPTTVIALMIAAVSAQVALAASTLLSGLLGHSLGGLRQAYFVFLEFPSWVVLLSLTAPGLWYLTRPRIRRELKAGHERKRAV